MELGVLTSLFVLKVKASLLCHSVCGDGGMHVYYVIYIYMLLCMICMYGMLCIYCIPGACLVFIFFLSFSVERANRLLDRA